MSRRRIMQQMQGGELPSGYTRVKYLENSGAQWIDTGITINGRHEIDMSFSLTQVPNSFKRIFGGRTTYRLNAYLLVCDAGYKFRFDYNSDTHKIPIQILQNEKYDVSISNRMFKINNYNLSLGSSNFATEAHYYLFYGHILNEENFNQIPCMKLYRFEIKEVIRLITALDRTGRPCMYDTVTQKPFYNSGTGEFGYELPDGTYVAPI